MDQKKIGKKIKLARVERGMTQEQLADAIAVRQKSISLYESGVTTPTLHKLKKMGEALNKSLDFFIDEAVEEITQKHGPKSEKNIGYWHFYDQGLFNYLARQPTKIVEKFREEQCRELKVDFETELRSAITFFSFLESIGKGCIPKLHADLSKKIIFRKDKAHSSEQIVRFVKDQIHHYLINRPELSREELIKAAKAQKSLVPEHVFQDIFYHHFEKPIEWLQGAKEDDKHWYNTSIEVLAIELTFQFPFFEKLAGVFTNLEQRKQIVQQIYHDFIRMAVDSQTKNPNISFYRALDCARKQFAAWGDAEARKSKERFVDHFSHQRNNEDLVDSDVVNLAIFGFFFQNERLPVKIFTLDSLQTIRDRLNYALEIIKWASSHMDVELPWCYGEVYYYLEEKNCFLKINVASLAKKP